MTIAEMLMNQKTRDFLVTSWSDGGSLEKIEAWNKRAGFNTNIIFFCLSMMLLSLVIWPVEENFSERPVGRHLVCILLMLCVLISFALMFFVQTTLWKFERESHLLFLELGAEIKTSKSFEELKAHAFEKLVKLAEYCLWAQTYTPSDYSLISVKQESFKEMYDLFAKFKLLHDSCEESGYKVYFDEAIVRSEVPDWFMKMDPSIKKESVEATA